MHSYIMKNNKMLASVCSIFVKLFLVLLFSFLNSTVLNCVNMYMSRFFICFDCIIYQKANMYPYKYKYVCIFLPIELISFLHFLIVSIILFCFSHSSWFLLFICILFDGSLCDNCHASWLYMHTIVYYKYTWLFEECTYQ